ncbi:hypothetical protein HDU96_004561 [Phlyctochytrium bullatum]|nr:hypothetical protein HDU96_004561 [Phlyctochytrium bullatum]
MEVVSAIFQVTANIFNIAEEVKANKEQCRQLVQRIRIIESTVKSNVESTITSQNRDEPRTVALLRLQNVLEDCRTEIHLYTDRRRWVIKLFRQLTNRNNFAGLHNELDRCQQDLQTAFMINLELGDPVVAQRNRDRLALEKDLAFLVEHQLNLFQRYLAMENVPDSSVFSQKLKEGFSKRIEEEQSIVKALAYNEGNATVEEFKDYLIDPADVSMEDEIGRGGVGVVYAGHWNASKVGLKKLHCTANSLSSKARKTFKSEARMLLYANHPNVVKFYGIVADGPNYMLVMEYFEKRCLRTVINESFDTLSWELKTDYAVQIALGMAYLHRQQVIHCDLKCNNILVRNDDSIAIADFGLAQVKQETRTISKLDTMGGITGTIAWMAPELFELKAKPSFASDVYAYAMILFELADGGYPFSEIPQDVIPLRVQKGERPDLPSDTPVLIATVIKQSWTGTPSQRPRFDELVVALKTNDVAILRLSPEAVDAIQTLSQSPTPLPNLNEVKFHHFLKCTKPRETRDLTLEGKRRTVMPLHVAAVAGHVDVCQVFLQVRANIDCRDNYGNTPLILAAWEGHVPVVRLLLEEGAGINSRDNYRKTALFHATYFGHVDVVRVLLEKNADTESMSNYHETPLMCAAADGHLAIVQLLVQSGADTGARDGDGRTAQQKALQRGRTAVADFLAAAA